MEGTYTVHTGPKGGAEYRQWTGEHTFRTVNRYVAWPHLSEEDKAKAERIIEGRKEEKHRKAENDAAWRSIMRGG